MKVSGGGHTERGLRQSSKAAAPDSTTPDATALQCGRFLRGMLCLILTLAACMSAGLLHAQQLTVAGASSLRPTLDYIVERYEQLHPGSEIAVIYGSSGRLSAQIINGAPFDVFLSADMEYPQRVRERLADASEPQVYAFGRLVLWSAHLDASTMTLQGLAQDHVRRIAIAQPAVAPYGERARQALQATGVWDAVQTRLVFGENISQAAQMAASGAADVGLFAQSLVVQPALATRPWLLVDDSLHEPLAHGMLITPRGLPHPQARTFMAFMNSDEARAILVSQGFQVPD